MLMFLMLLVIFNTTWLFAETKITEPAAALIKKAEEVAKIDKLKNTHYYIYTYVVTPFKMLYTKVPGFGNHTVDQAKLYKECIRRYDYLYTGKNLDIVNFKLNFKSLLLKNNLKITILNLKK